MPPPSLLQLCTAAAIRNVRYLNDIGNIPYSLARPFLLKIESPEKLRSLELQSPHLMNDDAELWHEFIKRDIPRWNEYELPEQPDCWYDVYCDLREQVQRAVDEDAEKLKMALDGINSEREKHSAKLITDRRTVRLPQERPTVKQRYAMYDRKMGGIRPSFIAPRAGSSSSADPSGNHLWSFERPSLPREQKKKNNIFAAKKRNTALAIPTKQLNNRATQVKQAPRSLIEEHRRSEPAAPRRTDPPTLRAPGRSNLQKASNYRDQIGPASSPSLREREARLRSITMRHTSGSSNSSNDPSLTVSSTPRSSLKNTSLPPAKSIKESSLSGCKHLSRTQNGSPESEPNPEIEESRLSPPPPRLAPIRKRPAPSVFIQPKKKKVI